MEQYYLDLGRTSFQQLLYRPVLPPLEGDGVISDTNLFFPFRFSLSLFFICRCCVEFKFAFTQAIKGQHSIAVILTVTIC